MKAAGIVLCLLVLFSISAGAAVSSYSKDADSKGLKLYSTKNYTDALTNFNNAVGLDPTNYDAWVHKGNTQRALKSYNDSIVSYNKAIDVNGTRADAWVGKGGAQQALKLYNDSLVSYR